MVILRKVLKTMVVLLSGLAALLALRGYIKEETRKVSTGVIADILG